MMRNHLGEICANHRRLLLSPDLVRPVINVQVSALADVRMLEYILCWCTCIFRIVGGVCSIVGSTNSGKF